MLPLATRLLNSDSCLLDLNIEPPYLPAARCLLRIVTPFINCILIYTIVYADSVQDKSTCKTASANHIALIYLESINNISQNLCPKRPIPHRNSTKAQELLLKKMGMINRLGKNLNLF